LLPRFPIVTVSNFLLTRLTTNNLVAFARFGLDKAAARVGGRRTRESSLLWLALLGWTAGAYAGRACFSHRPANSPSPRG